MITNELQQLPKDWLDTYEKLTASSVLAYSGVVIAPEKLGAQLAEKKSFYAGLVKIPALVTFNSLFNGQARDIQTYCQERLIEYILSGVDQNMTNEFQVALKDKIEETRLALIALGESLSDLEARHYNLMLSVYTLEEQQVAQWHEAIDAHLERLWTAIKNCQPDMLEDWKGRLMELLKTQAAGVTISHDLLNTLQKKEQPSPTESALIAMYVEAGILKVDHLSTPPECVVSVIHEGFAVEGELNDLQTALESDRIVALLPEIKAFQQEYNQTRQTWVDMKSRIDTQLFEVKPDRSAFPAELATVEVLTNQQTLTAPFIGG